MPTNRRAILHVDDDALFTQLAAQHFLKAGYESEAVIDPMVAMQTLIRGKYRVVVLDVQMPKKSGLQLLQEIKHYDAGIQVLLLTSLVSESTIIEAGRLGAEACFFKPLTNSQPLLEAIEDAFVRGDRWCSTVQDLADRRNLQAESPSA